LRHRGKNKPDRELVHIILGEVPASVLRLVFWECFMREKRRGKQNAEGSRNTLHRWAFDLHLAGGLRLGFEPGFSKNRFAGKSAGCELHHISSARSPLRTSFRGPVSGAGGTRYFEPDGVFFWRGTRTGARLFRSISTTAKAEIRLIQSRLAAHKFTGDRGDLGMARASSFQSPKRLKNAQTGRPIWPSGSRVFFSSWVSPSR
jgi:hypothetical protein